MFENPRTSTLALTKTDDGRYKVWLRLPVTATQAREAHIEPYRVRDEVGPFACAALLGYANALGVKSSQVSLRYLESKLIAMNAIAALDALCADKRLRQRARVCAWLVGADLSRIFGRACALDADDVGAVDVTVHTGSGHTIRVDARRGAELARTIRNGELNVKRIEHIDGALEQMLWCALKATDIKRADCLDRMDRAYDRMTWRFADTYDRHMYATHGYDPEKPEGDDFSFAHFAVMNGIEFVLEDANSMGLDGRETMSLCALTAAAATIRVAM